MRERDYDYEGPIGVGFPSVIRRGIVETANNIDATCIGTRIGELVGGTIDREIERLKKLINFDPEAYDKHRAER